MLFIKRFFIYDKDPTLDFYLSLKIKMIMIMRYPNKYAKIKTAKTKRKTEKNNANRAQVASQEALVFYGVMSRTLSLIHCIFWRYDHHWHLLFPPPFLYACTLRIYAFL